MNEDGGAGATPGSGRAVSGGRGGRGEGRAGSALVIRAAEAADLPRLQALLAAYVRLGLVRERSDQELVRELGSFQVAMLEDALIGCVALRIHSPSLGEVASLAVEEGYQGHGVGRRLIQAAVLRAHARGVRRVFAFTLRERLFQQAGFQTVPLSYFPQKLVTDYGGIALPAGRKMAVMLDLEDRPAPDRPERRSAVGEGGENLQTKRAIMSKSKKRRAIAILGGGNLGRALAMGWVEAGYCTPEEIRITRRTAEKLTYFADAGFQVGSDNLAAVRESDVIVLAVQPQQVHELTEQIRGALDPDRHRIISVISGVSIRQLRELLDTRAPIVRAMPNTAVAIGASMTCLSSSETDDPALGEAVELFDLVGRTLVIAEEMMIPATALCACGVAFFLRAIRAASQGGIEIGFHPEEALLLAAQTAKGSAMLLLSQGRHPESEIDQVTTPRGCTIAGLNEMEHQGFSSAMIKGILLSAVKAEGLYSEAS